MGMLNILPESFVHIMAAIGLLGIVIGFVLGFIPIINRYKLPIQVISILLFTIGIFFEGMLYNNRSWIIQQKELEAKVAQAEAKAAKKNVEIQEVVVTKTEVVKEKGEAIVRYIERIVNKEIPGQSVEITNYIENCPVPRVFIDQHNAATELYKEGEKK
jgi:hypothetical protein